MSSDNSNIVEAAGAEQLGKRIRELRTLQGLTLEALAEKSGVSRAMLSKIERGENNPTLVVAAKVAVALDVTMSELIGVEERHRAVKMAKDRRVIFRDPETGFERQMFPAFEGAGLEFMRHVIPPHGSSGALAAHRRGMEKYILMEQGTLRVVVGTEEYVLEAGDAFYFEADIEHRFDNGGDTACTYFLIKNVISPNY